MALSGVIMAVFRASGKFEECADRLSGATYALRTIDTVSNASDFDDSDEDSWCGLIDARHLQALQFGKQSMSQFGHGKYTVKVHIWPNSASSGTASDSQPTMGQLRCQYVMPTKARYAALHHLKTLERSNAMTTANQTDYTGEAHPLLVADLDQANNALSPGSAVGAMNSGGKGSKVIRFAFDNAVSVYGQDSFTTDINADGDLSDTDEWKEYTLFTDDDDHFGILPRYEASINPTIDGSGNTQVNVEWDMPLSRYKAYGFTEQVQPFNWTPPATTATQTSATFTNVEALGGLICLRFTGANAALQHGSFGNNDFHIYATVTCHSWTPMKR